MWKYSLEIEDKKKPLGSFPPVFKVLLIISVLILVVGTILTIIGIVSVSTSKCNTASGSSSSQRDSCSYSSEAKLAGLDSLLEKVKATYYKMNPNNVAYSPDSTTEMIRGEFSPYNCHPEFIKMRTDAALELYEEAQDLAKRTIQEKLKPREAKALAQVLHFLQSNFGSPYDENYYAGDWMLGPNLFCWQAICYVGSELKTHFTTKSYGFKPKTIEDVDFIIDTLKKLKDSMVQFVDNLKYGVQAGFVRSVEQCEAGLFAIQRKYKRVTQLGPQGVLNESYTLPMRNDAFLKSLESDVEAKWQQKSGGNSVRKSLNDALVSYVGVPIHNMLDYLKTNHSQYCVPSNISSGLAQLPLPHIYKNGINTGVKTTGELPNGQKLNGRKAYEMILPYFTTTDMNANEIYNLGKAMRDKLYVQAKEIAKAYFNESDEDIAVSKFKAMLNNQSMFFNDEELPLNETEGPAFANCLDEESAKINCPLRYKGMLKWIARQEEILSMLEPKTTSMFYFTGKKRSAPNCPVKVVPKFLPGSGSQSYRASNSRCSTYAQYKLPFFLKNLGPKYNAFSVAAHEARPGHHTQVQSFKELFQDSCAGPIAWLNSETHYTAFSEGWALYAENPLITLETDVYDNEPIQKYGMLKWQIWRALRLMIDTGLHSKGMTRDTALALFEEYAWDNTDKAVKDVTRYQSAPGQATAYMIGQLRIWKIRNDTQAKLGAKFNEKDFHYQVLSQGSSPLSYLENHLNKYAECVNNIKRAGCEHVIGFSGSGRVSQGEVGEEEAGREHDAKRVEELPERERPWYESHD